MTHSGTDYNIISYQETSLQYYEKASCIVDTVFNKRIKIFMKDMQLRFQYLETTIKVTITNKNIILTEFTNIGSIKRNV